MSDEQKKPEISRRQFVLAAGGLSGLLALNNLSCFSAVPMIGMEGQDALPPMTGSSETGMNLGSVENYAPGTVTYIPDGRFFLVRLEDGGFLALSERCTHLGCEVPWEEEQRMFVCPCHGSQFDINGAVDEGPADAPLSLYALTIENGIIRVNTDSPIRREEVNEDDVVYS